MAIVALKYMVWWIDEGDIGYVFKNDIFTPRPVVSVHDPNFNQNLDVRFKTFEIKKWFFFLWEYFLIYQKICQPC